MPYAVLTVGVILIALSVYLAAKQPPKTQTTNVELEEMIVQIQLAADDAIGRLEEKIAEAEALAAPQKAQKAPQAKEEPAPKLPALAKEADNLLKEGLTLDEIAVKLGRGKGEIQLALGLAGFAERNDGHE